MTYSFSSYKFNKQTFCRQDFSENLTAFFRHFNILNENFSGLNQMENLLQDLVALVK